jgi:hypothetical protein
LKNEQDGQIKEHSMLILDYKQEDDIDEHTFNIWKMELQKELPSFWDAMSRQ